MPFAQVQFHGLAEVPAPVTDPEREESAAHAAVPDGTEATSVLPFAVPQFAPPEELEDELEEP